MEITVNTNLYTGLFLCCRLAPISLQYSLYHNGTVSIRQ